MAQPGLWHASGYTMENVPTLEIIERSGSALSIISFFIIALTYWFCPSLRTSTFNRTIFFASWGNMGSNIATMISTSGPRAGTQSATCKIQAFLIQWFMPADALWAFCMALNVFFVFQTSSLRYRAQEFEHVYVVLCYGIPLIPALVYLVLDMTLYKGENAFYGDATLWCWISSDHQILRITTFYGPVWVVIGLIGAFYAYTGCHLDRTHVRNTKFQFELNRGPRSYKSIDSFPYGTDSASSSKVITKQTEFTQTTEKRFLPSDGPLNCLALPSPALRPSSTVSEHPTPFIPRSKIPFPFPDVARPGTAGRNFRARASQVTTMIGASRKQPKLSSSTNKHARIYALVAFMVFIALLIVWVPATINRIWGIVHKPSKTNNNRINTPMNYMSALVLPLQGFFNCLIYCFFSRKQLYNEFRKRFRKRSISSGPQKDYEGAQSIKRMPSHEVIAKQNERDLDPAFDEEDEDTNRINVDRKKMMSPEEADMIDFMEILDRSRRMRFPV
ncbi:hypothetical protein EJ08DRAFT_343259 [Tothia fuscella]|uniref:G-protein coupled receptors family 2 profile 2 domain-containing protein n=1 Tax=Tothia fuscella TaxID=1048955 RepID=A0A9P4P1I4_9PEZI|nr:hypothetical protein EJ08DRAFT_343259 [Tothia fuscella]